MQKLQKPKPIIKSRKLKTQSEIAHLISLDHFTFDIAACLDSSHKHPPSANYCQDVACVHPQIQANEFIHNTI